MWLGLIDNGETTLIANRSEETNDLVSEMCFFLLRSFFLNNKYMFMLNFSLLIYRKYQDLNVFFCRSLNNLNY